MSVLRGDSIEEWATIKAELKQAAREVLKKHGYTWATFGELEKLATEVAVEKGTELIETEAGTVQVTSLPAVLKKVIKNLDPVHSLHFKPKREA